MTWQKLLSYVITLIVGVILGWLLISHFTPKPTTEVREVVVRDTTYVEKIIKDSKENTNPTKVETIVDGREVRTYTDTLAGKEEGLEFKVSHTVVDDPASSVKTFWDYEFKQTEKIVKEYITKDSIRTVVDTRYIQAPFFINTYFYTTIAMVIITVLAIIF